MNKLVILISSICVVVSANAADWTVMGETQAATHYIDISSIKKNGIKRTVRTKFRVKRPEIGSNWRPTDKVDVIFLSEIECGPIMRSRYVAHSVEVNSKVVNSERISNPQWTLTRQGTLGGIETQIACSY